MALALPITDEYGTVWPDGYRRLSALMIDTVSKDIVVRLADYPSAAYREANPDRPFRTGPVYRIGPKPVPAVTDEAGNVLIPAVPSYDQYFAADATNPAGIAAAVYGFAKSRPENAGAKDV